MPSLLHFSKGYRRNCGGTAEQWIKKGKYAVKWTRLVAAHQGYPEGPPRARRWPNVQILCPAR